MNAPHVAGLTAAANGHHPETSSLPGRLDAARVDLLNLQVEQTRAYLPASDRMLPRAARIHIAAPMKSGKTLAMLAHIVETTNAGARAAILDRENGADEYARRLRCILDDRPATYRQAVSARLAYYAWPALTLTDGPGLPAALGAVDLVLIDSTRTFLTSLQLDEDRSDDFARYAGALVDPLFRAGITVIQLDNSGHSDGRRARGTTSKGDLADVYYSLKTTAPFDQQRRGTVKLTREHTRFGDIGAAFHLHLGAGHFGTFAPLDVDTAGPFRPTGLMESLSLHIEANPGCTTNELKRDVLGKNDYKIQALDLLIADGHVEKRADRQAHRHHSIRPYREAAEPPSPNRAPTEPGPGGKEPSPRAPSLRGLGPGDRQAPNEHHATEPLDLEARPSGPPADVRGGEQAKGSGHP